MYLLTSDDRVLAHGRGVNLSQLLPAARDRHLFLDQPIVAGPISEGPLTGFELIIVDEGRVRFMKDGRYLCAAPGWERTEHDRLTAAEWETFRPVSSDVVDEMCVEELPSYALDEVLKPSTKIWGGQRYVRSDPTVLEVRNCFYLPASGKKPWGVFGADGEAIYEAMTGRNIYTINLDIEQTIDDVDRYAPEPIYIYGGVFNCHFGHFLVDTLPRLWNVKGYLRTGIKILCHAEDQPERWFEFPYIAQILGALGVGPDDFVTIDHPVRIERLIVPKTSLTPQQSIHEVYGQFCLRIGQTLCPVSEGSSDQPIYYSRTRLTVGTYRVINESIIEADLKARGVKIVYPEQLTFAEQLSTMMRSCRIIATSGSYLHTSLFCPPRNMTVLTNDGSLNSNFLLIDKVTRSQVGYYDAVDVDRVDPPEGFGNAASLRRPRDVAAALYALATR